MDINSLNNLLVYLPRKKVADLYPHVEYQVTALRKVNTNFGQKVVAHLNDEFQIFVPKLVSKALLQETALFEQMNVDIDNEKLFIVMDKNLKFIKK